MSDNTLDPLKQDARRSQPPTIQDVASALGLHKSTVSFALSGKGTLAPATRQHIITVAREMGYEPNPLAQRLAHGIRNQTVCVVSGGLDVGLATEKLLKIQSGLNKLGLDAPIYSCSEPATPESRSQADQIRAICRERPRAVVCGSQIVSPSVRDELQAFQNNGGIVITYDTPAALDCDQVIFDREDNAFQAASYLLARGHRRIGLAVSDKVGWLANSSLAAQPARIRGFTRALADFGLAVTPEWIFHLGTYEQGGEELAHRFSSLFERPTGLCIVNDYVALAFMVEMIRAGVRLPQDLSIVGHDNQSIAVYCPVPLTSATHPATEIAEAVVNLLLSRLNNDDQPPQKIVITGNLVERNSAIEYCS